MPIMTTLLIAPLVLGRVASERAVGPPQLADDFGDRQIAVEALLAGRAELARQRAARLRRDAQRAAIALRNEHSLDRVARADVEQPFARAVGGDAVATRRAAPRSPRLAASRSRSALARSRHRVEIVVAGLMHPAHQLLRAKRLLAECRAQNCASPAAFKSRRLDGHGRIAFSANRCSSAGKK